MNLIAKGPILTIGAAFFSLLLFSNSVFAQTQKIEHPFLFSAERDGKVSFLFGSYHFVISKEEMPDFVLDALKSRPQFVEETLDEEDNKSSPVKPDSPSPKPTEKTLVLLKERGFTDEALAVDPSVMCLLYDYLEAFLKGGMSLDSQLEDEAKQAGKKLLSLDESSDMTNVTKSVLNACNINEMVNEESPSDARNWFQGVLRDYRSGDESMLKNNSETLEIKKRNQAWLAKIIRAHSSGGAFITVGSGHLGDSSGLIALLEQSGFHVERISSPQGLLSVLSREH